MGGVLVIGKNFLHFIGGNCWVHFFDNGFEIAPGHAAVALTVDRGEFLVVIVMVFLEREHY